MEQQMKVKLKWKFRNILLCLIVSNLRGRY